MLGLGETKEEVIATLQDLRDHDCDMLTLGQYLQPSRHHLPVDRFVHPDEFAELADIANGNGVSAKSPAGQWCVRRITPTSKRRVRSRTHESGHQSHAGISAFPPGNLLMFLVLAVLLYKWRSAMLAVLLIGCIANHCIQPARGGRKTNGAVGTAIPRPRRILAATTTPRSHRGIGGGAQSRSD